MNKLKQLITVGIFIFVLLLSVVIFHSPTANALVVKELQYPLREVVPGFDYAQEFRTKTNWTPNANYFGAYAFKTDGDTLYVAIGAARPAEDDGGMFGKIQNNQFTTLGKLDEQGAHTMIIDKLNRNVYLGGSDPCCQDDWSAGNFYAYNRNNKGIMAFNKYRDPINGLKNVIHTWGLWQNDNTRAIYTSNSGHNPITMERFGEIFKSIDEGKTWQSISRIGHYRAYDIIGVNNKLYTLYNNENALPSTLAVSTDDGVTWTDILGTEELRITRLTVFNSKIIAVGPTIKELTYVYTIDPVNESVTRQQLPFRLGEPSLGGSNYNQLVVANNILYTTNAAGHVMYTKDLQNWYKLTSENKRIVAIGYWPAKNWLLLGDLGSNAKVWYVDLNTIAARVTPLPTLTATQVLFEEQTVERVTKE